MHILIIKDGISTFIFVLEVLIMRDHVAHLDNKKRITLRGAIYRYYNGKEYGRYQELSVPKSVSARTLADTDRAVNNFKRGDVSSAIDLSDFLKE